MSRLFGSIGQRISSWSRSLSEHARKNPSFSTFLQIAVLATPLTGAFLGFTGIEGDSKTIITSSVTFVTVICAALGILTARGNAEVAKSADQRWKDGYYEGITHWRRQAGIRAGALRQVFRQINSVLIRSGVGRPSSTTTNAAVGGDEAVRSLLNAITNATVIHFALDPSSVNANLMVPTQPKPKQPELVELRLVRFAQENYARSPNNRRLKVDSANPSPGAARAFCTGEPQYIRDAREVPEMPTGRPYRAIMSWPVVCDNSRDVLGVVNVDSSEVGAFGALDEEGTADRMGAMELCSDALQAIGISLLDSKCFPCDGTRI